MYCNIQLYVLHHWKTALEHLFHGEEVAMSPSPMTFLVRWNSTTYVLGDHMTRQTLSLLMWNVLGDNLFDVIIVIVHMETKSSHAKTIRLGSGTCLGPTQRPEEQGQPLRGREETFKCRKLYLFLSKYISFSSKDTEGKRTSTIHKKA